MIAAMVLFFLVGVVALLHGVALVSVPVAWMVFGGVCLLTSAWPLVRR